MGSGWCAGMEGSWFSGGGQSTLGLQRQRVDRSADLLAENRVDEAVLLDAAAARERRGGDSGAEVIAAAGGPRPRARAPGMAASMRCLISSVVGME